MRRTDEYGSHRRRDFDEIVADLQDEKIVLQTNTLMMAPQP